LYHFAPEEREGANELLQAVKSDKTVIDGMNNLLLRSYFTRAWIFQEIILAGSRGIIQCGTYSCPWNSLKTAFLGFSACGPEIGVASSPSLTGIVQCEDTLRQNGVLELPYIAAVMSNFKASDPRDKIFATLRLAFIRPSYVRPPAADYTRSVQEVYINATRYFIDLSQGVGPWNQRHRSSAKIIPGLPSWVPDFMTSREDLYFNPFMELMPKYSSFIRGYPTTTSVSLYIDGCILDRVVFKVSITKETDIYSITKSAVQALSKQGRSIYDPYLGTIIGPM
jgi:hypothetical protein